MRARYDVRDLAAHLATVLERLNSSAADRGKVAVLGSSSGGYFAQQLAVDHPDLLAGLVLAGTPSSLAGRPAFAEDVERLTDPVDAGWVAELFTWFPLHHPVPAGYVDDRIRDGQEIPAHVWRDTLEGLYLATPPLHTGTITVPTLVIAAGNDDLLGTAHLDLVEAIPNARAVVYEDTGHLILWSVPIGTLPTWPHSSTPSGRRLPQTRTTELSWVLRRRPTGGRPVQRFGDDPTPRCPSCAEAVLTPRRRPGR